METGLGGRLDATSVLRPCLTVTTNVSRDHVEILGATLRRIAGEKAGIVKPGVPHLIGILPGEAEKVMRTVCRKLDAPFHSLRTYDFGADSARGRVDFNGRWFRAAGLSVPLPGKHQLYNCALALAAVDVLCRSGFKFTRRAVRRGLQAVDWPGRFQVVRRDGRPTLVLDVCHNAGGARAFVATFAAQFPGRKTSIILGLVKRKEHQLIVRALSRVAADFSLVPLRTKRSTNPRELLAQLDWTSIPVRAYGRLGTAYGHLLKSSGSDDIITVTGSHYLVGELLRDYMRV